MTGAAHSSGHATSAHSVMAPHEVALAGARGSSHPATTSQTPVAGQAIQQWPEWAGAIWLAIMLACFCTMLVQIAGDQRKGG